MWVPLTLLCAFSLATSDALTKRALGATAESVVGWLRLLFALPSLLVVLVLVERPPLDGTFFLAFAGAMPLEVLAFVLYVKALRVSPLGLTVPFLALTPVFLIGFSYVILGETPSLQGIAGVALIAVGGYSLNLRNRRNGGVLEPIRAVTREKGSLMMLAVALIYSATSSLGKVCINHSSPFFFGATYFSVLAMVYTPIGLPGLRRVRLPWAALGVMAAAGLLHSVMVLTHMQAMSMTNVAYMIAVKRTSLLFSVLYGWLWFREERPGERLAGAVLMLAGFVLITVAG